MSELEFWKEVHAALLKQARDLQEQRAAVLQQAAAIEKKYNFRRNALDKLSVYFPDDNSNLAGIVANESQTK